MHLDLAGVAVSSGSACSTGAVEPSHVLVAMGVRHELALGTVRFSLGRESTSEDVARAAEVVPGVVEKVRKLAGVLGRTSGPTVTGRQEPAATSAVGGPAVPPHRRTAEESR
jgi:cysteine desulfurase